MFPRRGGRGSLVPLRRFDRSPQDLLVDRQGEGVADAGPHLARAQDLRAHSFWFEALDAKELGDGQEAPVLEAPDGAGGSPALCQCARALELDAGAGGSRVHECRDLDDLNAQRVGEPLCRLAGDR